MPPTKRQPEPDIEQPRPRLDGTGFVRASGSMNDLVPPPDAGDIVRAGQYEQVARSARGNTEIVLTQQAAELGLSVSEWTDIVRARPEQAARMLAASGQTFSVDDMMDEGAGPPDVQRLNGYRLAELLKSKSGADLKTLARKLVPDGMKKTHVMMYDPPSFVDGKVHGVSMIPKLTARKKHDQDGFRFELDPGVEYVGDPELQCTLVVGCDKLCRTPEELRDHEEYHHPQQFRRRTELLREERDEEDRRERRAQTEALLALVRRGVDPLELPVSAGAGG